MHNTPVGLEGIIPLPSVPTLQSSLTKYPCSGKFHSLNYTGKFPVFLNLVMFMGKFFNQLPTQLSLSFSQWSRCIRLLLRHHYSQLGMSAAVEEWSAPSSCGTTLPEPIDIALAYRTFHNTVEYHALGCCHLETTRQIEYFQCWPCRIHKYREI